MLGGARPARAQSRELRWDPALDIAVTGVGAAAWVAAELLQPAVAPAKCRWCDVDEVDAAVRRELLWGDPGAANALSNVTGFALAPLVVGGLDVLAAWHDDSLDRVGVDALLIVESVVIAADVNTLTKLLVGRERPFVHALAPAQKEQTARPSNNNLSFFSGHTTETFALAAAAGTVATMRGYREAPVVWGAGAVLAAATGYLRIAADAHWLTDVLVGAVIGAGIGVGVPLLFHRPESGVTTPVPLSMPVSRSAAITLAW
jgi:membrane-associated phospholipid phosphatase